VPKTTGMTSISASCPLRLGGRGQVLGEIFIPTTSFLWFDDEKYMSFHLADQGQIRLHRIHIKLDNQRIL